MAGKPSGEVSNGLQLAWTPGLRTLLETCRCHPKLSEAVRVESRELLSQDTLTWRRLKVVYQALREVDEGGPLLHEACQGGGLVLDSPKPREKSPELLARLETLQRQLEQQQYDRMVRDVTVAERAAKEASEGAFVTYKQQMGFGVHVLVMMGTFYALGHTAVANMTSNQAHRPIGGLIGMMFAMLLETFLFIMRTNPHELKNKPKPEVLQDTSRQIPAVTSKQHDVITTLGQTGSGLTLLSSSSRQGEVQVSQDSSATIEAKKDR